MKRKAAWAAGLLTVMLAPQSGVGLPWSDDMRDQPSVKSQESQVAAAEGAVPVTGAEPFPVPKDLSELVQTRLRAGTLPNPVAADEESIETGRRLFDVHCLVCHGATGAGDGLVGKKYIPPPINLTLPYIQMQPDGQIFYTITHGSVQMPYYRDAMSEEERWHLVNYVKHGLVTE